ncbi:hypothetical protein AU509_15020 [Lonsdalea britannica]|nr:hypothetical protein AU509_15020 [Lonsdalea britannica]OSN06378.1 hypothetical protein AU510_07595 [Lonsdalea britannica]
MMTIPFFSCASREKKFHVKEGVFEFGSLDQATIRSDFVWFLSGFSKGVDLDRFLSVMQGRHRFMRYNAGA